MSAQFRIPTEFLLQIYSTIDKYGWEFTTRGGNKIIAIRRHIPVNPKHGPCCQEPADIIDFSLFEDD